MTPLLSAFEMAQFESRADLSRANTQPLLQAEARSACSAQCHSPLTDWFDDRDAVFTARYERSLLQPLLRDTQPTQTATQPRYFRTRYAQICCRNL